MIFKGEMAKRDVGVVKIIVLFLLILLAGQGWGWLDQRQGVRTPEKTGIKPVAAPAVTFEPLGEGEKRELAAWRGKYVLLNFWGSWCLPCAVEFPALLRLAGDNQDRLALVAVSVDTNPADALAFLGRLRKQEGEAVDAANIYYASDPQETVVSGIFQSFRYPESILIDPDGRMIRKFTGPLTEDNIVYIEHVIDNTP